MKSLPNNQKGFTLVELLVVIGILGILMVGTLVALNPFARFNSAKDANARSAIDQVSAAAQSYYAQNQSWPANVAALLTSGDLQTTPTGPNGTALSSGTMASGSVFGVGFTSASGSGMYCWRSNGNTGHQASGTCP